MCRACGACVLSTWHVKSTRCISIVKVLFYRLSSCAVSLDTISQPSHLPRVHCHKGMVCQQGGGEHIYIYIHMCLRACVRDRACLRACVPAFLRACVPACVRSCVRAFLRACVTACVRSCVRAFLRTCVPACVHSCVRAFLRACVPACMRSYRYVRAFLRACLPSCTRSCVCVCVIPVS